MQELSSQKKEPNSTLGKPTCAPMERSGAWRVVALVIAILGTATALDITARVALERGATLGDRIAWLGIGLTLTLCVHVLPVSFRLLPLLVRSVAYGLWVGCFGFVCWSHATFLLSSQQQAGEQRAQAIDIPNVVPSSARDSGRGLALVANDIAETKARLAANDARRCRVSCSARSTTHEVLSAKLEALRVEADEAKRWQVAEDREVAQADRAEVLRDAVRDDPVAARLATWSGATVGQIDLVKGAVFAFLLEGAACLCWYLVLSRRSAAVVTVPLVGAAVPASSAGPEVIAATALPESQAIVPSREAEQHIGTTTNSESEEDMLVAQLGRDVAAGLLRPTQSEIRRHLGCAQGRAGVLRRRLIALLATQQPTA